MEVAMATPSLTQHYTIKEFQLLVKDAPVIPAEIKPFVGVSFRCSADIYRLFKGLAEMTVETFRWCTWTARTAWWA